MSSFQEKLAEHVLIYPVLYDKSSPNFKDIGLGWGDVAATMNLGDGMYLFLHVVSVNVPLVDELIFSKVTILQ